jgi:ABC-type maltose transport system permease subunit
MPTEALLAVLLGALLHAGWNAAIKSGTDKFLDMVLVATGAGAIAAMVPITVVFLALQRHFVSASLAGALKG